MTKDVTISAKILRLHSASLRYAQDDITFGAVDNGSLNGNLPGSYDTGRGEMCSDPRTMWCENDRGGTPPNRNLSSCVENVAAS